MGRFARSSERDRTSDSYGQPTPRPSFIAPSTVTAKPRPAANISRPIDNRTPSEARYFVLALAALIGLGIGWLAGKAITGSLHSTPTTQAVAAPATQATFDGVREHRLSPASAEGDEPTGAQAASTTGDQPAAPEADASDESSAPLAVATQPTTNDQPARVSRRAARRTAVRRAARGNPLLRPFKALRRFRVW